KLGGRLGALLVPALVDGEEGRERRGAAGRASRGERLERTAEAAGATVHPPLAQARGKARVSVLEQLGGQRRGTQRSLVVEHQLGVDREAEEEHRLLFARRGRKARARGEGARKILQRLAVQLAALREAQLAAGGARE